MMHVLDFANQIALAVQNQYAEMTSMKLEKNVMEQMTLCAQDSASQTAHV